jgi:leucine dehydrogenase
MQKLIEEWSGESVVARYDRAAQTWMFIAIHDTTLGAAMGGCRMKVYAGPDEALRDAMRLAEGMTYKWATIGFDLGGGKSVLAVPRRLEGTERDGLFRRFGRLIDSLKGAYACGPDLGTTPEDMAMIARETPFVHGGTRRGETADPGPYTALGVWAGMRAAVRQVFGSGELTGRSVLIEGVGDVGIPLARMLRESGARILVSDIDAERAAAVAAEVGGEVVAAERVYQTPCDVYAPCAVGATLNAGTIPELQCRIVAGSANNQLSEPEDGERLHDRGILYAPDYVINAGGATALPLLGSGEQTEQQIRERIEGFEGALDEIFSEAAEGGESPLHAAVRRVERVLDARRRERWPDG